MEHGCKLQQIESNFSEQESEREQSSHEGQDQPRKPPRDYFSIRKQVEVLYNWGDCPNATTLIEQWTLQTIRAGIKYYLEEYAASQVALFVWALNSKYQFKSNK